jgi:hypothetical protein
VSYSCVVCAWCSSGGLQSCVCMYACIPHVFTHTPIRILRYVRSFMRKPKIDTSTVLKVEKPFWKGGVAAMEMLMPHTNTSHHVPVVHKDEERMLPPKVSKVRECMSVYMHMCQYMRSASYTVLCTHTHIHIYVCICIPTPTPAEQVLCVAREEEVLDWLSRFCRGWQR